MTQKQYVKFYAAVVKNSAKITNVDGVTYYMDKYKA